MEEENFSEEITRKILPEPSATLAQCRKWFQAAVDHGEKWRKAAKEDYEFVAGNQWTDAEIKQFQDDGRPAITINRIKPLLNILSGYQRLNRYDIDFLARTSDDVELCQVRRGITKYVMDRCEYDARESATFLDCAIGGLGWFNVRYQFDHETQDGEAVIERVDPFGMYVDPDAHELDFSDARFLIRAKWVAKDELKQVYPEHAEAIENNYSVYDTIEKENEERIDIDPPYIPDRGFINLSGKECDPLYWLLIDVYNVKGVSEQRYRDDASYRNSIRKSASEAWQQLANNLQFWHDLEDVIWNGKERQIHIDQCWFLGKINDMYSDSWEEYKKTYIDKNEGILKTYSQFSSESITPKILTTSQNPKRKSSDYTEHKPVTGKKKKKEETVGIIFWIVLIGAYALTSADLLHSALGALFVALIAYIMI